MEDAIRHHNWANLRLIDACSSLSDEQLGEPVPAIYGSVIDTLRHVVDSDAGICSGSPAVRGRAARSSTLPPTSRPSGLRRRRTVSRGSSCSLRDSIPSARSLTTDGETVHTYVGLRLAQAVHHGSDHRSQICTALTRHGVEPPAIDVWDYGESVGRITIDPAAVSDG